MMASYRTLAAEHRHEIDKIKGSRFLATVGPASNEEEALELLGRVRRELHDARHHCSAWRFGLTGRDFRSSDDGEPSGSAGKPILAAIDGRELVDVVVVVTRWFGGTKLGVGGLVRAYGAAAAEALDRATIETVTLKRRFVFEHPYDCSGAVQGVLTERGVVPVDSDYGETVKLKLALPLADCDGVLGDLVERTAGRGVVTEE